MKIKNIIELVQPAMDFIGRKPGQGKFIYPKEDIKFYSRIYKHKARFYHVLEHIYDIMNAKIEDLPEWMNESDCKFSRAIQVIAGFKHDIFQLSIDKGVPEGLEWIIDYKKFENSGVYKVTRPNKISKDLYNKVLQVFGYDENKTWAFDRQGGLNEFLSALETAYELTEKGMHIKHVMAIIACIEASVPFRSKDKIEKLCERLEGLGIGLSEENIKLIGIAATDFANRDVENFAGKFSEFINNTRMLIPELSPEIKDGMKAVDFRKCLIGSVNLMTAISKDKITVFCQYEDFPEDKKFKKKEAKAKENACWAKTYLQSRYVTSSFLAAMAINTGQPDIKMSEITDGTQTLLDKDNYSEDPVLKALQGWKMKDIPGIDLPAAPLAAFLYERIGGEKMGKLFKTASENNLSSRVDAQKLLSEIQSEIGLADIMKMKRSLHGLSSAIDINRG